MDLSKIPTEDLQAIQAGHWDKVSTPGLQEYQSQRQHLVQAQQQAQNPQAQTVPDSADKSAHPSQKFLDPNTSSAENAIKMTHMNPQGSWAQVMRESSDQAETPKGAQQLATALIPGSAQALSKGAGLMGRMGTAGLAGGTTAVGLQNPDQSYSDKLSTFLKGGAVGMGAQGTGELGGKMGDYLMQRSVGMRKYLPGVGTSLADQGVMGTKNMMANQTNSKLASEEENLQGLVGKLSGSTDAQEISDAISKQGDRFKLPSTGDTAPNMEPYADKVKAAADEFKSMGEGGELSPQDLLSIKRQGDWVGYTNSGNPASSLEADLGRAQADKARGLLSDMSSNGTAESLGKERALILAKKALEKPEAIHQGLGAMGIFGKIPGTSILESLMGQGAVKSSQAVANPNTQRVIEQGLFGQ